MINVCATVSIFIHVPTINPSTDCLFEQRIGRVTMDLLYIRFTYETKDKIFYFN